MVPVRIGFVALFFATVGCNYFPQVESNGVFVCQHDDDCAEGFTCHFTADGEGFCCRDSGDDPNGVCGLSRSDGGDSAPGDTSPGDSAPGDPASGDPAGGDPVTPSGWQISVYSLPAGTREITALWGRSANEVYAGSGSGKALRYDGSGWREWAAATSSFNNGSIHAIWGDATNMVFGVGNSGALVVWDGANFQRHTVVAGDVLALAGVAADDLYAVVRGSSSTALFHFDGTNFTNLLAGSDVGVAQFRALLRLASGDLLIGGSQGKIFSYSGGASAEETVALPTGVLSAVTIIINDFVEVGGEVYAVSADHCIYRRGVGHWDLVFDPVLVGSELRKIAGWAPVGGTELVAVGLSEPLNMHAIVTFDGSTGEHVDPTQRVDLWSLWSPGAGDYFLGGMVRSSIEGRILRMRAR